MRPACVLRPQPPRLGTPVVRNQAGRLFHRSTRVPLVFPAPNLCARDHRSSANKRDACSTAAHASRLCSPPPISAKGQGRGWTRGAGHLAAVAANLRQPEPSGLASRGAREWRRAGAWRRTLRAKSVRTKAAEEGQGPRMGVVGRRRVHSRGRTRPAAARANSLRLHQKAHPMHALRRVDAGGGRNHDVEALRNMMTIRAKRGWTGTE